ncbi:hypothetical protein F7Q99_08480 [Streptomyces kaniharaensis]|uniref:Uncharacterized protein n=1 Tax=Streptomyces kaniharaensis TaxID=212423 RepID=A0A6N7KNL7_9ACTN|nr:hypothetical protein [Streptomyces kaniharaensis]MQS12325.1 hypothetical protein [Streptomyces kaniharaensis]
MPGAAGLVPRPRRGADGDGDSAAEAGSPGDRTAARVRAALAERLRTAYDQGRSIAELADACRRPVSEVRTLLGENTPAGQELGLPRSPVPAVPAVPVQGMRSVPILRTAREEVRTVATRRPSPSRRLRQMHPQAVVTGPDAAERETAARAGATRDGAASSRTVRASAARGSAMLSMAEPAGFARSLTARQPSADSEAAHADTPLGILIGGGPHPTEAVGRPEERAPVRVTAESVRIGRGTSLVVLPSWRPAIAVSVPTEQLLSATGLAFEQLAGAQLTVLINPGALHDRELDLHDWQAGRGRRSGRPYQRP